MIVIFIYLCTLIYYYAPQKNYYFCNFICIFHEANCQKKSNFLNNISVEYGLNWVDSSGNLDPLTIFKDYSNIAFTLPFKLELDYLLNNTFELYLAGSSNKFLSNQIIDERNSRISYTYLSIDFGVKHAVFEIDILTTSVVGFAKVGLGVFKVESIGPSANIGAGGIIRINENTDVVISSQAKFAIDNEYLNSNHFQYFLGLKYRFGGRGSNCFCLH